MSEQKEKFFDKAWWQQFWLSLFTSLIMFVIATVVMLFLTGYLERFNTLMENVNSTLVNVQSTIETVAGVDAEQLREQADALSDSATAVGEGVGDGGAEVINRAGEAWNNFLEGRESNNE